MIRYAASTGGFYPYDIHYPNLPADCVDIAEDYHAELMAAQDAGKVIVADAGGQPIAVDPTPPSAADLRAHMALTRRQVIIGMALEGLISHAEGVALAATGVAPPAVEAMLAAMPEPNQTAARITLASFTVAYRNDPMVALFQAAGGMTDEQMDAFFTGYAAV